MSGKSPGRKRLPVDHPVALVDRVLKLVDADGRALDEISRAAGLSQVYLTHLRKRCKDAHVGPLMSIVAALGYTVHIVRDNPKGRR
jgi:hypothetical protein